MVTYKHIFAFLLAFVSTTAFAQYTPMTAFGYQMKRVSIDSTLHIPSFCGVPTLRNSQLKNGALAMDTCNNKLYKYTNANGWSEIAGGGGGSQSLQQVTDIGSTTTNTIEVQKPFGSIFLEDNSGFPQIRINPIGGAISTIDLTGYKIESLGGVYSQYSIGKITDYDLINADDHYLPIADGVSDTLATLTDVRNSGTDTTSLSNRIDQRVKYSDTATMLAPYLRDIDTTNAFISSVSQPNDSTLTFYKGGNQTSYTLRSSVAGSATRLVTTVYNNSGVTITKGSVVYINGRHSSNLPTIALAQANSEENSYATFALVENDILNNNSGVIIQAGNITNLNLPTANFTDGDVIFLSATTAGGITRDKSTVLAPNHIVKIGTVTRAHPTFGTIEIKIENGWQMDELSDVAIPLYPNDSTLLQYSRVDSLWHAVSIQNAIGSNYIKPSDTSVFQRKNVAAYTFKANNTNAAANSTDQVFRDPGVQTYTGTITWTGTTAPSGTTNHSYNWTRVGNQVTLNITLNYGTAGSALTAVNMALPADCPAPKEQSGLGAANDILYFATGQMTTATNASNSNLNRTALRVNGADTGYEVFVSTSSGAYRFVNITVQYFVN